MQAFHCVGPVLNINEIKITTASANIVKSMLKKMPNWKNNLLVILSPRQFQSNFLFQIIHSIKGFHWNLDQKETRDIPVAGNLLPASQGFPMSLFSAKYLFTQDFKQRFACYYNKST